MSRLQSPDSLHIVTMAVNKREVEARSEACAVLFRRLRRDGKLDFSPAESISRAVQASLALPEHYSEILGKLSIAML